MPSILPKLNPRRSLRKLQTAFSPSDSHDSSSPSGSSPTSAVDFRGLDKTLDAAVTNLILTNIDENGAWANTGTSSLSPSTSNSSTNQTSPNQESWQQDAPLLSTEQPRGLRRMIRKKKSKVELLQTEEKQQVRGDLLGMVEPRPGTGNASGTIEEVLTGEA